MKLNKEKNINNENLDNSQKNNKNGIQAILLSIIACILYIGVLAFVVNAFKSNIAFGILSIFLIPLVTVVQKIAVDKAKEQRKINKKGLVVYLFAKYFVPLFALVAILGLIFGVGLLIK